MDLGTACVNVTEAKRVLLSSAPWAMALDLPGEGGGIDWIDGGVDRELVLGAVRRSLWSIGNALDADNQADIGMVSLATGRVLGAIASELALPTGSRVAYTVPDAVDEFSQRSLRSAMASLFHHPVPVWRSVAAAMAWASAAGERGPRDGDAVVVVDTEFSTVSLTVLTARYDEKLEKTHPSSRGIYWERMPPLPPDEGLEALGWPHVLREYARMLVKLELNSLVASDQERVVEDLLRSGKVDSLVANGGSVFVHVPSNERATPDVAKLSEDSAWFQEKADTWSKDMDLCVRSTLSDLEKTTDVRFGQTRALLIGGPSACSRFRERRPTGRILSFNSEGEYGFIKQDDGSQNAYFRVNDTKMLDGLVPQKGIAVEFDVQRGPIGPIASRIASNPLAAWLRQRTVVTPDMLASGARECLLRRDTGSKTWYEWLPELSLEVVRDGHFGELPLIKEGQYVDAFLGDAVQIEAPEDLTLPRGHRWFAFPLLVGRQGRRPVPWEARLDSPAFPLGSDARAKLCLLYRYGLENSYELAVEPVVSVGAPFAKVHVKWVRGGEDATKTRSRETLVLEKKTWDRELETKFLEMAGSLHRFGDAKHARYVYAVTRDCWSWGRSHANCPDSVRSAFPRFRDHLLDALPAQVSACNIPPAIEILSLLHEDIPSKQLDLLLKLDEEAGSNRERRDDGKQAALYKKTAEMLAMAVGDGRGKRGAVLNRLLCCLDRHANGDTFDPELAGLTMRALAKAAWRHPEFVRALAATLRGAELVIARCRWSLNNLFRSVPVKVVSDEQRKQVSRKLGTPFMDACKLLLALMAVDPANPAVAPLQAGSQSAVGIAKLVRQIDARFASIEADLNWRVKLEVTMPPDLHRMSQMAYWLNQYLTGDEGANLVRVNSVDLD